nr:hypothetical protein [Mycobacterium marinum]
MKKPDDGLVVEFPKPGAAGISMIVILAGPRVPPIPMSIEVVGPPMFPVSVGPVIRIGGRTIGPTSPTCMGVKT